MNKFPQQRRHRNQAGAAMVEFAFALPVVVMLLFGFTEVGRALYQQNVLTKAVSAGSRLIARSPDALTSDCAPDVAWSDVTSRAADLVALSRSGEPRLDGLDDAGAVTFSVSAAVVGGTTACVIRTSARTAFTGLFGDQLVPFMENSGIELSAQEEERYIGQ